MSTAAALLAEQRAEDAEAAARQALSLCPADREASFTLARALLMQGRWREGWDHYEHRPFRVRTSLRALPYPEWRGEPLAGKKILVWGEQGIGDEIMFSRFLPRLRELGAAGVAFACHKLNLRALAQLGADVTYSHTREQVEVPAVDYWVLVGSLPRRLGVTPETLSGAPYLTASRAGPGGVGLVGQGNPLNPVDRARSIPAPLLQQAVPEGRLLLPAGDVQDSLEQVAGLDLLITVDTSWAHMAGALGVSCWVLLPYQNLDWRWLRERADTPWYDSVRLFRQRAPGDWAAVLADVRRALTCADYPGVTPVSRATNVAECPTIDSVSPLSNAATRRKLR
jgi:hypothetical protein